MKLPPYKLPIKNTGSTLIEILFATVLLGVGLLIILLSIIESNRSNVRTHSVGTALNVIQTQIDADSRVDYDSLQDSNPPLIPITGLPDATITRSVTENTSLLGRVKQIRYILTWGTPPQTLQNEYELTEKGIAND